jgi:hypothetical protein
VAPPVVPPPAVPPVPEVPPPAAAPPVPDPLAGADTAPDPVAELEAGTTAALELDELEAALEEDVLVGVVVGVVVVVVGLAVLLGAATVEVGTVRAGASALSAAGGALLPQPARVSTTRAMSAREVSRSAAVGPLRMTRL